MSLILLPGAGRLSVLGRRIPFVPAAPPSGTQWTGTVRDAASPSQASVQTAINASSDNDIVRVPPGSDTWNGLAVNKGILLIARDGLGTVNITLGANNTITKRAAKPVGIQAFNMARSGADNSTKAWIMTGAWTGTEPVMIENNIITTTGGALFRVECIGGLIFAKNVVSAGIDDEIIQFKDTAGGASWTTADTMGVRDSTGKLNHYVEDNDITGGNNQGIDADDGCRLVFRNNRTLYFCLNSHGWDTSAIGVRHVEGYDNNHRYINSAAASANMGNGHVWIRGGTYRLFRNQFDDITGWGASTEIKVNIRGAEDTRPQGICANVIYPVPRQAGQGHNGSAYFTDPVHIWGNTGATAISAGWNWGNPCGLNFADFWQLDRDYKLSADPSYAEYQHPHPLRSTAGLAY